VKRTIQITVETERVIEISSNGQAVETWCPLCRVSVTLFSIRAAARIAGVTSHVIDRWIAEGLVHCIETATSLLRICEKSLCDQLGAVDIFANQSDQNTGRSTATEIIDGGNDD
jgi:hypothetical protein